MPTYNEIRKLITKAGCHFIRNGAGSAEIWENPQGLPHSIHFHGREEVKKGTLHEIKKWAGLK